MCRDCLVNHKNPYKVQRMCCKWKSLILETNGVQLVICWCLSLLFIYNFRFFFLLLFLSIFLFFNFFIFSILNILVFVLKIFMYQVLHVNDTSASRGKSQRVIISKELRLTNKTTSNNARLYLYICIYIHTYICVEHFLQQQAYTIAFSYTNSKRTICLYIYTYTHKFTYTRIVVNTFLSHCHVRFFDFYRKVSRWPCALAYFAGYTL